VDNPIIETRVAQLYDASVPDWPGEIDFYRELAAEAAASGETVLEVACGTGRVAVRLAQGGVRVVGVDISAAMLDVARAKSAGIPHLRWVEGDMRAFKLDEKYGLAIMPGHPFQVLLTPEDQLACLMSIRQHLVPDGKLVVHLDYPQLGWLWDLSTKRSGIFEEAEEFTHPQTGSLVRTFRAWSYEPCTQTASSITRWEEISEDGSVISRWERGPIRLHCVFRFEMEHLLARAGLEIIALYGDFERGALQDDSEEMIFVARKRNV
jgi:SAM-dependent methyltransferase